MNPSEEQIEKTLRQAPRPRPSPGLRRQLVDQIQLPAAGQTGARAGSFGGGWFSRWWPALATCALAVAALVVYASQQSEINQLRQVIETLQQEAAAQAAVAPATETRGASSVPMPDGAAELASLRTTAQQLSTEIAALEALRTENARLKTQTAAALGVSAEALEQLANAKEKAQSIACINNLKQLGLAARMWATDNGDVLPPNFTSMSNELFTPKVLVCPADTARQPAADWGSFTMANVSYEFLAPSGSETEPQRVVFRCPIHGHVCLADGSVQSSLAKTHPEWFIQRDGKLMLEQPQMPAQPAPTGAVQPGQMDPEMMKRYGLVPAPAQPDAAPTEPPQ